MLKNGTYHLASIQFLTVTAGIETFFVHTFTDSTVIAAIGKLHPICTAPHTMDGFCRNFRRIVQHTPLFGGFLSQLIVIINDWATWATKRVDELTHESTFYYGSAWFTYGDINTLAGNYVVRSSGYCRFRDEKIPADGSVVNITAIYTKFSQGSDATAAYQLLLNKASDVVVTSK